MEMDFDDDVIEFSEADWEKYDFVKTPPFAVGNIVKMKSSLYSGNRGRLMRVTAVRKELSQSGWTVCVIVNNDAAPIFDLDGTPCRELRWMDCGWFIKYEN